MTVSGGKRLKIWGGDTHDRAAFGSGFRGTMNFEEHASKPLLRAAGIETPDGRLAASAEDAEAAAAELGGCAVIKAQVPTGKRGKAGGIKLAATPAEARMHAAAILGMTIGDFTVDRVLVEVQVPIAREMYAAVLNDAASKGPLLLFSAVGGIDIEELAAHNPDALFRLPIDIRKGLDVATLNRALPGQLPVDRTALIDVLARLFSVYARCDAELIEINPLIVTDDDRVIALDCKFVLDDSAVPRQRAIAPLGTLDKLTELEACAQALGLKFIELDGDVGILANGAGLTMTSMDTVRYFGGRPANFLEIGGESYTKAKPALELVLAKPGVKALLVNFCGAFARTDVMAEGLIRAWKDLEPSVPVFFTIHGTGEEEAIAMVRRELGIEPFDLMDDAVKAAVAAARSP
jgi:succinyl-CoA synthetase beta subunit